MKTAESMNPQNSQISPILFIFININKATPANIRPKAIAFKLSILSLFYTLYMLRKLAKLT